jgi:uncharacterized protein (DUF924 family)
VTKPEDILAFWFPPGLDADEPTHLRQIQWWFRGGADQAVVEKFAHTVEAASRGEFDRWAEAPRSRLALVIILDQFSCSVYRNTQKAFAQDEKALRLAVGGLERGFYDQLETVWEKTFFSLPLSHSERLDLHERNLRLAEALVDEAPICLRKLYEFSASQAHAHHDVIARFASVAPVSEDLREFHE